MTRTSGLFSSLSYHHPLQLPLSFPHDFGNISNYLFIYPPAEIVSIFFSSLLPSSSSTHSVNINSGKYNIQFGLECYTIRDMHWKCRGTVVAGMTASVGNCICIPGELGSYLSFNYYGIDNE